MENYVFYELNRLRSALKVTILHQYGIFIMFTWMGSPFTYMLMLNERMHEQIKVNFTEKS